MIDFLSSGERTGKSLNTSVCKRCSVAGCGLWDFLLGHATGLRHWEWEPKSDWKAEP